MIRLCHKFSRIVLAILLCCNKVKHLSLNKAHKFARNLRFWSSPKFLQKIYFCWLFLDMPLAFTRSQQKWNVNVFPKLSINKKKVLGLFWFCLTFPQLFFHCTDVSLFSLSKTFWAGERGKKFLKLQKLKNILTKVLSPLGGFFLLIKSFLFSEVEQNFCTGLFFLHTFFFKYPFKN